MAIITNPSNLSSSCFSSTHRRRRTSATASAAVSPNNLKKLAAMKAVEYVKSNMVLGLGTGITAGFFVAEIGALVRSGELSGVVGVPTSKRTFELAKSAGIPLSTLDEHPMIDLAVDGADEVDPNLNLVKGRGGALLREKMVESASDRFVVVVDDTRLVPHLGGTGLAVPVEVVQFCWRYNQTRLQELFSDEGCEARLRLDEDGKPSVTDNSNYTVDLFFRTPIRDLNAAGNEILALKGVVEHGLFLDMADEVIISAQEGLSIKIKLINSKCDTSLQFRIPFFIIDLCVLDIYGSQADYSDDRGTLMP